MDRREIPRSDVCVSSNEHRRKHVISPPAAKDPLEGGASTTPLTGDSGEARSTCRSCGGRGWRLRSVRRAVLVRGPESADAGPFRVDCWRCQGTGGADPLVDDAGGLTSPPGARCP